MVSFHNIRVAVTPTGNIPPAGEVPCSITPIGPVTGGSVTNDRIRLDPGQGPFCIQFELDNRLQWDAGDPIWVKRNRCPNGKWSAKKQIWVDDTPENQVMTIMNMNVGNGVDLHYRLNFTNGRWCDPIMENGGGNVF